MDTTAEDGTKTSSELRKINKPLVERRRRERMKFCLDELKTLVLRAKRKNRYRNTKLEKADVLEMTVKYLRNVQRQQLSVAVANDVIISSRYRAGLTECAHEVCSYLKDTEGVEQETLTRLANHLNADITVCTCHTGMSQDVATGRPYTTSGAVSKPSHLVQLPGMCPSGQLTSGQASGWRQRLTPHSGVGQLGSTPLPKVSACGLLALPKGQVGLAHLLAQLGNNTSRYGDVDRDTEVDTQTPGNRSTKDGRHPETSDTSCLWVNCENKAQNNHATHTNTPSVGHTRAQNKTDVRNLTVEPIWRPW